MPAKNIVKVYLENGYYHLYNRGVEKRKIFIKNQDYKTFLYFLKTYLSPPPNTAFIKNKTVFEEIKLMTYVLMPNHFHLLVKQSTKDGITKFIRRVCTNYVMYFNKNYDRTGTLFQGIYKAVLIKNDEQLLHLSRYIHLNPLANRNYPLNKKRHLLLNSYSSYADYLGKRKTPWLHPEEILSFFKSSRKTSLKDILSYQSFVEDYKNDYPGLKKITLE